MFDIITANWNPVKGCLHDCSYCWAKRYADRLKNTAKYADGFKPALCKQELNKKFKYKFVFAVDMGDLFGEWVPSEWIQKVIDATKQSPTSNFLFLTKNPERYYEFLDSLPGNVVLGATIESNRTYPLSKAPSNRERYCLMANLPWDNKLISIEPIMDFDLEVLVPAIKAISPAVVYVGYDNYNNKLPEPSLAKTKVLIQELEKFTRVRTKTLREPEVSQNE
jgi:protein gp37